MTLPTPMPSGSGVLWGTFCKSQGVEVSEPETRGERQMGQSREKPAGTQTRRIRAKEGVGDRNGAGETDKEFTEKCPQERNREEMGASGWGGSTQSRRPDTSRHTRTPTSALKMRGLRQASAPPLVWCSLGAKTFTNPRPPNTHGAPCHGWDVGRAMVVVGMAAGTSSRSGA